MLTRQWFVGFLAVIAIATAGCEKKAEDKAETSNNNNNNNNGTSESGSVSENDGETVAIAGQLQLDVQAALTDSAAFDSIIAVPVEAGEFLFESSHLIKGVVESDGTFSLDLPQIGKTSLLIDKGLKADGTVDRAYVEAILPEAAGASDQDIIDHIAEKKAARETSPESFERSYVVIAYKSASDKVTEAESMVFIGMPAGDSPLLGLPITKAKGNLNFGKTVVAGEVAKTSLKADTTSFDLDEAALAEMTNLNDALKTLKNIFINTDLESNASVEITPTFNWAASMAALSAGTAESSTFENNGYSAYIAPRGKAVSLSGVCAESEADRLALKLYPPEAQTRSRDGFVFDAENPITNLGALGKALAVENGGDRKSCMAGDAYFAGGDDENGADELTQIGMISFARDDGDSASGSVTAPTGWWTLKKADETFATFDLGLSSPVADDGHIKMFVPKMEMTTSGGNVTKLSIKFMVWDASTSSYRELTDLAPFRRVMTEFGIGFNQYNENGGSSEAGGARPATIVGNAYVVEGFMDQSQKAVTVADPSAEATKGSIMLYYRAFGNSYNFFWR